MKKRQWNVQRRYVEQPDARARWDRSYQSLIEWGKTHVKRSPFPRLLQENNDENRDVRSGVNESVKHKHKQSSSSCICCMNTAKSKDGSGKSHPFFGMMGTAEQIYAAQDWIISAIRYAMQPLTACS